LYRRVRSSIQKKKKKRKRGAKRIQSRTTINAQVPCVASKRRFSIIFNNSGKDVQRIQALPFGLAIKHSIDQSLAGLGLGSFHLFKLANSNSSVSTGDDEQQL
jgi:hypothetical protein